MIDLGDGNFYLEKGERFPYKCPQCGKLIAYFRTELPVTCSDCGHTGSAEDFGDAEYEIRRPN